MPHRTPHENDQAARRAFEEEDRQRSSEADASERFRDSVTKAVEVAVQYKRSGGGDFGAESDIQGEAND